MYNMLVTIVYVSDFVLFVTINILLSWTKIVNAVSLTVEPKYGLRYITEPFQRGSAVAAIAVEFYRSNILIVFYSTRSHE